MKVTLHKPFFSIVIPTYNRATDLDRAIKAIINQEFQDFEVIVSDNHSSDETSDMVKAFGDKRIKYNVNSTNIGWIPNLQKGIRKAQGKYILLHGDDDWLIDRSALTNIYSACNTYKPGYLRVNYLSKFDNENTVFDFDISKKLKANIFLPNNRSSEDLITFIESTDPYFITGICFQNNANNKVIHSELIPWFPIIFDLAKAHGGYYLSTYHFISKWIKNKRTPTHPFFVLQNGRFTFETYYENVKLHVTSKYYQAFLRRHTIEIIYNLPANKLATHTINAIRCARRCIDLNPTVLTVPMFWIYVIGTILTPKIVLRILKTIMIKLMIIKSQHNLVYNSLQ